jgi:hypothetical protein
VQVSYQKTQVKFEFGLGLVIFDRVIRLEFRKKRRKFQFLFSHLYKVWIAYAGILQENTGQIWI